MPSVATNQGMRALAAGAAITMAGSVLGGPGGGLGGGNAPRPTDGFGHDFVTIGAPGNRAALPEERYYNQRFENLGRVNYRYRISKTEVRTEQWFEFVNAYWSYWEADGGARGDPRFTSNYIGHLNSHPNANPNYQMGGGTMPVRAVTVSWEVAARYCNWLHNGKVNEEWAFESGAYDASTFVADPEGGYDHQPERSPGARFWIPNVDEWVKAAHHDPDRYGEDQEGYWLQKGGQQTPLTPGLPENGGQTSGGNFLPGFDEQHIPVGSYPNTPSPWGVLDTSGGAMEWTETVRFFADDHDANDGLRYVFGSAAGSTFYASFDRIDYFTSAGVVWNSQMGIRLASAVPAPGSVVVLAASAALLRRTRTEQRLR